MNPQPNTKRRRNPLPSICLAMGLLFSPVAMADGVSIETDGDGVFDGVSVVGLRDEVCSRLSDLGTNPMPAVCAVCGNGVVEGDEECDGSDLNGSQCTGLGLVCSPACTFDTSACAVAAVCSGLFVLDSTLIPDIELIDTSGGVGTDMTVNCPTPEATLLDADTSGTCCSWDAFEISQARILAHLSAPGPNDFFQLSFVGVYSSDFSHTPIFFQAFYTASGGSEQAFPNVRNDGGPWYVDFGQFDGPSASGSAPLRFELGTTDDWDICEIQIQARLCKPQ